MSFIAYIRLALNALHKYDGNMLAIHSNENVKGTITNMLTKIGFRVRANFSEKMRGKYKIIVEIYYTFGW